MSFASRDVQCTPVFGGSCATTACTLLAALAILPEGGRVHAAPIVWGPATAISGSADVLTTGSAVFAYNWANSGSSVNGQVFTAPSTGVTLTGFPTINASAFTTGSAPYANLPAAYRSILQGAAFSTVNGASGTVALNSLTSGYSYAVQFWVNDPRGGNAATRSETLGGAGGTSMTLAYASGSAAGTLGQFAIGLFDADAATQSFTVTPGAGNPVQVNTLQLRNVTNIGAWVGTAGSTWDAAATANFATNLYTGALSLTTFDTAKTPLGSVVFGDQYWNAAVATPVTQTAVTIAAGGVSAGTVRFTNSTVDYTLSSADATGLTGTTSIVKTGTGRLVITGANTYTGSTIVSSGALQIGNGGASGSISSSSPITGSAGATLAFNRSDDYGGAFSNTIGGGMGLSVQSGTLTLSGSNAFTGPVSVNGGTLRVSNTAALGAASGTTTANVGGTLDINGTNLGTEPVVLAGGMLVNGGAAQQNALTNLSVTTSSTIGGSARWDVRSAGSTLTVNAGATLTKIDSNTIYLGVSSSIVNNGEIVLNAGTLATFSATITGTGRFTVNNGRNLLFESNTSNPLAVTLNSGTLSTTATQSGAVSVATSTTNSFRASGAVTLSGNLAGSGRLNLVHATTGTITVSGTNSGFGGTLGIDNTSGSVLFGGASPTSGSAAYAFSGTNGGSFGAWNRVASSPTLRLGELSGAAGRLGNDVAGTTVTYSIGGRNSASTFGGVIENGPQGTTALLKEGTGRLALTAANTYAGSTTISGGTLALGVNGSFTNSPTITVGDATSSGAVLDLTAKAGLYSLGSGQTLKGGGTVRLAASGTLAVPGTFSPGNSPGLFTYDGGTTLLSGTTLMEIMGPTRATGPSDGVGFYDAVNVVNGGKIDFTGGILQLTFATAFADNTSFELFKTFDTAALNGSFANVDVTGSFYTGLTWSQIGSSWKSSTTAGGQSLEFNSATGTLVIVPEPHTIICAGIGIAMAGWSLRRRRR